MGRIERDGITRQVTIVPAQVAKGLEFAAVVVVDPSQIAAGAFAGLRLLYVVLSRLIHKLVIVHAEPLPPALSG